MGNLHRIIVQNGIVEQASRHPGNAHSARILQAARGRFVSVTLVENSEIIIKPLVIHINPNDPR